MKTMEERWMIWVEGYGIKQKGGGERWFYQGLPRIRLWVKLQGLTKGLPNLMGIPGDLRVEYQRTSDHAKEKARYLCAN